VTSGSPLIGASAVRKGEDAGRTVSASRSGEAPMAKRVWADRAATLHTSLAIVATLGASLTFVLTGEMKATTQAIIMAILVALLGLPHGAFDLRVGRAWLQPRFGGSWITFFVGGYIAIAVAAAIFWTMAPAVGLTLLLIVGMAHWGDDDLEIDPSNDAVRLWLAISRGAIPVALPCLAYPVQTTRIFEWLGVDGLSGSLVRTVAGICAMIAAPGILIGVVAAFRARSDRARVSQERLLPLAEVASLAVLMFAAPPLLAFTIYFCFWHSIRHSIRSAQALDPSCAVNALRLFGRSTIAPTAATILAAAIVIFWLMTRATLPAPKALAQVVFIGLFALTIPHALLDLATRSTTNRHPSTTAANASH